MKCPSCVCKTMKVTAGHKETGGGVYLGFRDVDAGRDGGVDGSMGDGWKGATEGWWRAGDLNQSGERWNVFDG